MSENAVLSPSVEAQPPSLREALAALCYVCDGARTIDGMGLNKFDQSFGRDMVSIPQDRWTPRQSSAIHNMLRKYRVQLIGLGINYDQIPVPDPAPKQLPEKVTEGAIVTIEDRTTRLLGFAWPFKHVHYDQLYLTCKAKLHGRWNPEKKMWFVTLSPGNVNEVTGILDLKHLEVAPDVRDFISETSKAWEQNIHASHASSGELAHIPGVNPELAPFPFQRAGIAYALDKRSVLFADEMGLGKGLAHGTGVLTIDGYVPVEALSVGDHAIGSDGKPYQIVGVYPQGEQPRYRVTFNDGASVVTDGVHLWNVQHVRNGHRAPDVWETVSTADLLDRGLRDGAGNATWRIPMVQPVDLPQRSLPLDPYIMGLLLGDGGISQSSVFFTTVDQELVDVMTDLAATSGLRVAWKDGQTFALASARAGAPNWLVRLLRSFGLLGRTSHTKFIPSDYLYASASQRLALLRGLMDTDGSARPDGINEFCSMSADLADGVTFLVESLGGIARRSEKRLPDGEIAYRVNVKLRECPFRMQRKAAIWKAPTKYPPCRIITKIELVEAGPTTCIAVDSPDHLFVTERCVVTHNTPQSILTVQAKQAYPVLVIAPASLKLNWKREWERWVPGTTVYIAGGRKPEPMFPEMFKGSADVLIVNYDVLPSWVDTFKRIEWKAVIADEAHYCKSYKSQRTKAAKELFAHIGSKNIRLLLTGTPILNDPMEIWPLLQMIGLDKPFGSFRNFQNTYAWGGPASLEKLNLVLRAEGMVRRRKVDVLKELPPLTWSTIPVEISAADRREYDRAEADLSTFVANMKSEDKERKAAFQQVAQERAVKSLGSTADPRELKKLTATIYADLMQGYRDSETAKIQSNEQMLKWNYLRQLVVDAKLDACVQFIEEMVSQGEKVIVFGWHQRITKHIAAHFNAPTIIGGMKQEDVQRGKDKFQEDPNCMVIVLNIAAGGVGHTLTASSNVVFVEFGWNPGAMDQAAGRAHRIGQENPVTAYQLVVDDTIDADFIRLVDRKRVVVDAGTEGAGEEISSGVMEALNKEIEDRIARKKAQKGLLV